MTDTWFVALLAGGGLVAVLLIFQRRLIYFPLRYSSVQLQEAKSIGIQEIRFQTSQGNQTAFLLVDYPGYGICQGKPNPRTILENAEGALQTLLEWMGLPG
jgi:hypothetical protein